MNSVNPFDQLVEDTSAVQGPARTEQDWAVAVERWRSLRAASSAAGALAVLDTDLPALRSVTDLPVHVVLTGGAGQVAGPAALAARHGLDLRGLSVGLRDVDDLAGNVRRVVAAVDAARGEGVLDESVAVCVEIPDTGSEYGWRAALDEVAAAELSLSLRLSGAFGSAAPDPVRVAGWIDAALDSETRFRVHGLGGAVRRDAGNGPEHGVCNVLAAVQAAWDGADTRTVAEVLGDHPDDRARSGAAAAASARRWLLGAGLPAPREALASLG